MSVFTQLARPELETFLAPYGLGRLLDFQGIAAGSENTNYFISLEKGEYVLTLVERGPVDEMPFFIQLLDVLHDADLPVPYALRTQDGQAFLTLNGVQTKHAKYHQFEVPIDPYVKPGDPSSGLLPHIQAEGPGEEGSGDHRVQAAQHAHHLRAAH